VNSPTLLKAALGRRGSSIEGQLTGAALDSQYRPSAVIHARLLKGKCPEGPGTSHAPRSTTAKTGAGCLWRGVNAAP